MNSETSMPRLSRTLLTGAWLLLAGLAQAAEVKVAVAANFSAPMREIAAAFERDTGHKAVLSLGATGTFYTQIRNGAPFEVLLAADDRTPAKLASEGLALAHTRFSYATGRLVLWSAQPGLVDANGAVLRSSGIERLAIADPKLAPYGQAAIDVLTRLGLLAALQPRLVQGKSIAQAHQFAASGNATLGFVALSQVQRDGLIRQGSAWIVPADLHAPLRQDAILLLPGKDKAAASALLAYLRSDTARRIAAGYGYGF